MTRTPAVTEKTAGIQDWFSRVKPVRMREPLAELLGVFKDGSAELDYSYTDAVKMAGHACPTVSAAYLCVQSALEKLYQGAVPVRGEIAVTVYGEPDDGVYGVMAQVFSFITGAAPETGFKGLGHRFRRKDLLSFKAEKPDPEAMCFGFQRTDTGQAVLAKVCPRRIPFAPEKAERLGTLMQPVIWEAATAEERAEFQSLWMEKIKDMLLERKDISRWLKVEWKEGEQ